jgi:hypothetical protein
MLSVFVSSIREEGRGREEGIRKYKESCSGFGKKERVERVIYSVSVAAVSLLFVVFVVV